jgi:hypothetical protein
VRAGAQHVERSGHAFRCAEELQFERHTRVLPDICPVNTVNTATIGAIRTSPR